MNKQINMTASSIHFKEVWTFLSTSIGSCRLPINATAKNIHQFLISSDDQLGFMKDVIKQSYKRNQCNHLNSPVSLEIILDILGETAYQLRHNQQDDLIIIELLEEIAWLLVERFGQYLQFTNLEQKPTRSIADIISFPDYRVRKANAEL